ENHTSAPQDDVECDESLKSQTQASSPENRAGNNRHPRSLSVVRCEREGSRQESIFGHCHWKPGVTHQERIECGQSCHHSAPDDCDLQPLSCDLPADGGPCTSGPSLR